MAERIGELVGRVSVREGDGSRLARYGDVFVLAASRNLLAVFEQALKRAGIPFVGARRGGLLDTLEAADIMALLAWLTGPANDLALTQVLRSPVFAWTDAQLLALPERLGGWTGAAGVCPLTLTADWEDVTIFVTWGAAHGQLGGR